MQRLIEMVLPYPAPRRPTLRRLALCLALTLSAPLRAEEPINTLEALRVDAAGQVELFGRQDPTGPPEGIPFLEVLSEALRNSEPPQFSLDSDFSQFTQQKLAGRHMEDLFYAAPGRLSPFGQAALEALGVPAPEPGQAADFTALLLRQAGFSLAGELHAAMPPDESMPSPATRSRWVELLGLGDDLRRFLDSAGQGPAARDAVADRFYGELLHRLAHSMSPHAPRLVAAYRSARDAGATPDRALGGALQRFGQAYQKITAVAVDILLERHERAAVVLDAAALQRALGVTPRSQPRFVNLEPRSQLARILLEGDVALKSLPLDHSLTAVEGYRTFPQWARASIRPDELGKVQTNRLWISLEGAQVEIRESPDGTIASFGEVRMQVDSRTKGAGESWSDERQDDRTQAYADLLSRHYDALATRVPELYQLREAAKMVAAAHWIRARGRTPALPEPTLRWDPPQQVEGFLAMIASHHDGRLYWGVLPSGGVDFDFDIVVTTDPSLTLEALRSRARGGPLSRLERDALEDERRRVRDEMDRTAALARNLGPAGTAGAAASVVEPYRMETERRLLATRDETDAGLGPSVEALLALGDELRSLPTERRAALLERLGSDGGPRPGLDDLDDVAARLAESRLGGPQAVQARGAVLDALRSWVAAWSGLRGVDPGLLAELPSLELFMARALGTLVAFALYRDLSHASTLLSGAAGDPRPALEALGQHQARRLEELDRRLQGRD